MGANNCCATNKDTKKDIDETMDMKKAQKKDEERKRRKEQKIYEKKKAKQKREEKRRKAKSKGNSGTSSTTAGGSSKTDESNLDKLLPPLPDLEKIYHDYVSYNYLKENRDRARKFWKEFDSYEWSIKKKAEDVELYVKETGIETQVYTKRVIDVDNDKETVAQHLQDLQKEKTIKAGVDKLVQISDLSNNARIIHLALKGSLLLGARDFCYCNTRYNLKNGDIYIFNHCTEHDEVPEGKPIRGMMESAILVQPISEGKTLITKLQMLDMKGNVPGSMMKKILVKQHEEFISLKDSMER